MSNVNILNIHSSEDTPEVHFNIDAGEFLIKGRSLPENAFNFYSPIIEFVKSHKLAKGIRNILTIHLDYFNSSSGRFLFELLTILENSEYSKESLVIKWVVEADDELMIEKGEELQSMLDLNFEIEKI